MILKNYRKRKLRLKYLSHDFGDLQKFISTANPAMYERNYKPHQTGFIPGRPGKNVL